MPLAHIELFGDIRNRNTDPAAAADEIFHPPDAVYRRLIGDIGLFDTGGIRSREPVCLKDLQQESFQQRRHDTAADDAVLIILLQDKRKQRAHMRRFSAGTDRCKVAKDVIHAVIFHDKRKGHDKAGTVAVGIDDLVIGIGRNDHKVRFGYIKAVILSDFHTDMTIQSILDLIEGVLGVLGE